LRWFVGATPSAEGYAVLVDRRSDASIMSVHRLTADCDRANWFESSATN
jgi:hypothetical protein